MDINIIVSPLVGAAIGYITNAIAIKMLFKPAKPIYLGKFRVPLTPGLIPKEKARLARSIGDVVGQDLLSEQTVRDALLSPEIEGKLRDALTGLLARGAENENTLGESLEKLLGPESASSAVASGRAFASRYLTEKLVAADLGTTAAHSMADGIKKKTPGGLGELLGRVLDDRVKQSVIAQVQTAINGYIERHAGEIIAGAVDGETEKLLSLRVCDLVRENEARLPALVEEVLSRYRQLIDVALSKLLGAVDIAAIVRGRIEAIDDRDLEKMIFAVVKQELNAIVYLGALLGFVMGFFNLLFL